MKNVTFKRLACIVMVAILLLPVLASVALAENAAENVYEITKQPTAENPTVITNRDDSVLNYKWYYVAHASKEYEIVSENNLKVYVYDGYFTDGGWYTDDGYLNVMVIGMPGDVLKVEVPSDFEGDVCLYGSDTSFELDENGAYYMEITEGNNDIDFEIANNESNGDFKIYVERGEKVIPVEMEGSGIDEENGILYSKGTEAGKESNGKWYTQGGILAAHFILNKQVEFVVESAMDITVRLLDVEYAPIEPVDGKYIADPGVCILVVEAAGSSIGEAEMEISAIIDGITYACKNYKVFTYNDESKTANAEVVNDGYYQDGKWHPSVNDYEIDIEVKLELGYVLTVDVSDSFDGEVSLNLVRGEDITIERVGNTYTFISDGTYEADLEIWGYEEEFDAVISIVKKENFFLEDETGASINPNKKGEYYVVVTFEDMTVAKSDIFKTDTCTHGEFSTQPRCEEGAVCKYCEEALEPLGHKFSEWKTVNEATSDEKGEEKRICTVCGKTEAKEIEATNEGGGNGIIFIIIGSGFAMAAIAVGAAWIVLNKKSLKV